MPSNAKIFSSTQTTSVQKTRESYTALPSDSNIRSYTQTTTAPKISETYTAPHLRGGLRSSQCGSCVPVEQYGSRQLVEFGRSRAPHGTSNGPSKLTKPWRPTESEVPEVPKLNHSFALPAGLSVNNLNIDGLSLATPYSGSHDALPSAAGDKENQPPGSEVPSDELLRPPPSYASAAVLQEKSPDTAAYYNNGARLPSTMDSKMGTSTWIVAQTTATRRGAAATNRRRNNKHAKGAEIVVENDGIIRMTNRTVENFKDQQGLIMAFPQSGANKDRNIGPGDDNWRSTCLGGTVSKMRVVIFLFIDADRLICLECFTWNGQGILSRDPDSRGQYAVVRDVNAPAEWENNSDYPALVGYSHNSARPLDTTSTVRLNGPVSLSPEEDVTFIGRLNQESIENLTEMYFDHGKKAASKVLYKTAGR